MDANLHQDCNSNINLFDQRIKSSSRRRSILSHSIYLRILSILATTTSSYLATILLILSTIILLIILLTIFLLIILLTIILLIILSTIFLSIIGLKALERRRSIVLHNTIIKSSKKIEILDDFSS